MAQEVDFSGNVNNYIDENKKTFIVDLMSFINIDNNVYEPAKIRQNATYLKSQMELRGITTQIMKTKNENLVVFGELVNPKNDFTLLFYSHFDGVPANEPGWSTDPFKATLKEGSRTIKDGWENPHKEWRLYGRSAADSKNAIMSILFAIDYYQNSGLEIPINLKFYFDGEEEMESPGMLEFVSNHADLLRSDFMVICSGEVHQSGLPTVKMGIRGMLAFDLELTTATSDLHSGHFGNFAINPILEISRLVATFKDTKGRVAIEGFYEEVIPLNSKERSVLAQVPSIEKKLEEQYKIQRIEVENKSLQELLNQPTLNIRGINGGYVGEQARNIIPNKVLVSFDCRLVKGMDPTQTLNKIIAHIEKQGFTVLRNDSDFRSRDGTIALKLIEGGSFPASRLSTSHPIASTFLKIIRGSAKDEVVVEVTDGGSLALHCFNSIGIPFASLPLSNYDCNQHTANENLELNYFFNGISTLIHLIAWENGSN